MLTSISSEFLSSWYCAVLLFCKASVKFIRISLMLVVYDFISAFGIEVSKYQMLPFISNESSQISFAISSKFKWID